jgi:preprotein translocase subunit SecG
MAFIIGLLTFIMVLDCLVLILLVLIQLPKKEAGAGLAFGGAATDALFGAGSGTVLTKVTKYAATIFFVLAFILAVLQSRFQGRRTSDFERLLEKPAATAPAAPVTPAPATPAPATTNTAPTQTPTTGTNALLSTPAAVTNAPIGQ